MKAASDGSDVVASDWGQLRLLREAQALEQLRGVLERFEAALAPGTALRCSPWRATASTA